MRVISFFLCGTCLCLWFSSILSFAFYPTLLPFQKATTKSAISLIPQQSLLSEPQHSTICFSSNPYTAVADTPSSNLEWYALRCVTGKERVTAMMLQGLFQKNTDIDRFVVPWVVEIESDKNGEMVKKYKARAPGTIYVKLQWSDVLGDRLQEPREVRGWGGHPRREKLLTGEVLTVPSPVSLDEATRMNLDTLQPILVSDDDNNDDNDTPSSNPKKDPEIAKVIREVYKGLTVGSFVRLRENDDGYKDELALVTQLSEGQVWVKVAVGEKFRKIQVDPKDVDKMTSLEVLYQASLAPPMPSAEEAASAAPFQAKYVQQGVESHERPSVAFGRSRLTDRGSQMYYNNLEMDKWQKQQEETERIIEETTGKAGMTMLDDDGNDLYPSESDGKSFFTPRDDKPEQPQTAEYNPYPEDGFEDDEEYADIDVDEANEELDDFFSKLFSDPNANPLAPPDPLNDHMEEKEEDSVPPVSDLTNIPLDSDVLSKFSKGELREMLKERGLKISGNKDVLIERLILEG
eukprot:Nitzschia sp. Nitz4//scaffold61_size107673//63831//65528//NITZ4_004241-RA/size107673-snap-gene-0.100-mRNA-1//1//CDS//3329555728//2893//frame0